MIINKLAKVIKSKETQINDWLISKQAKHIPLFYYSVDIRNSGQKLVPVDTNLFPAGFNNISSNNIDLAAINAKNYLDSYFPNNQVICLLAEDHDRNKFYLTNLSNIIKILKKTGRQIICVNTNNQDQTFADIDLELVSIIKKENNLFTSEGNKIDLVVLNNDLSNGIPYILQEIETKIIPNPNLGWFKRSKAKHFECYSHIISEFSKEFGLDPFYFSTQVAHCGLINFKEKQGLDCLTRKADELLVKIKKQYLEHNISHEPYLFIKANAGTYGMGVMAIHSSEEILNINKKQRQSMNIIKGGLQNTEVIIQEGVETIDNFQNKTAEPMAYFIGNQPLELLYRVHNEKSNRANLNSVGMEFINNIAKDDDKYRACMLIAKLAATASLYEI